MSPHPTANGKPVHIEWVDTTRAVSMCLIYLAHSYVYCHLFRAEWTGGLSVITNLFVVASGYLFYHRHPDVGDRSALRRDLYNILCRLVLPTLLFSLLLYFPKLWFNHEGFSRAVFLRRVPGGMTFWFTSALAVTQVIYALLFSLRFLPRRLHLLVIVPLACIGIFSEADNFPWHWQNGLEFLLYYALGGLYCMYEQQVNLCFRRGRYVWIAIFVSITGYYVGHPTSSVVSPVFQLFNIACFPMAIILLRRLPAGRLAYIGRNSLAFYLLSGLVPATGSALFSRILPTDSHLYPCMVFLFALTLATCIVGLLRRYAPWTVDFRRLHHKSVRSRLHKS